MGLRNSIKLGLVTAVAVAAPLAFTVGASAEEYACTSVSPAPGGAAPTGPAVACTTVEETVTGSALTLTAPATEAAPATLLGAVDKTTSYSIPETTGDNTGTGDGWNETISQTPFTSGAHVIGPDTNPSSPYGANGAAVTAVATANVADSTNTAPVGTVTLPVDVPAPTTSATTSVGDSPSVLFDKAEVGSGLGNFVVTPTVTVEVPANTYAGAYTATTEVDLTTGP